MPRSKSDRANPIKVAMGEVVSLKTLIQTSGERSSNACKIAKQNLKHINHAQPALSASITSESGRVKVDTGLPVNANPAGHYLSTGGPAESQAVS